MAERATCVDNLKEQNQLYTQQLTTALMESNSIKTDLLKHKDQIGALQVERERLLATNEHQKYQIEVKIVHFHIYNNANVLFSGSAEDQDSI